MMADIIRHSVWIGPGLEDVGAVFTDESYQFCRGLGKGKNSRILGIMFGCRRLRRRVDGDGVGNDLASRNRHGRA
jgi:hypothetical protein